MSSPSAARHFFIIGAQRCGTTYLYRLLDQHPEIEMARPIRPEPKVFLDPALAAVGRDAYERTWFAAGSAPTLRGEKGTTYIEFPEVAERITGMFPDALFLVLVREPVARAVSNWRFSAENGLEQLPAAEALTPEAEARPYDTTRLSTSPYAYLRRGRYADYLEPWLAQIPPERLRVAVFEELTAGEGVLRDIQRFLGVRREIVPEQLGEIVNAAAEPPPALAPELLERLQEMYREPNARLEGLLGRPLDAWARAVTPR